MNVIFAENLAKAEKIKTLFDDFIFCSSAVLLMVLIIYLAYWIIKTTARANTLALRSHVKCTEEEVVEEVKGHREPTSPAAVSQMNNGQDVLM